MTPSEGLDPQQRAAVEHEGNVVVGAGPGSGKTRTLVARAAHTLARRAPAFRGVACVTYTNAAAAEVRSRLTAVGAPADRFACTTVHGFCLAHVLRPFSHLVGERPPDPDRVFTDGMDRSLLQRCLDDEGVVADAARRELTATRIRRALACGEPVTSYDDDEVRAVRAYETRLAADGSLDFEAMTSRALTMLRDHEPVRDLLAARFPYLCVDEYQDLGGVLHQLVLTLVDETDVEVFAVGDPDQSVYAFTGADPRYMRELAARDDFADLHLETNYRSGDAVVRASAAVLGRPRPIPGLVDAPEGTVLTRTVDGDQTAHALESARVVLELLDAGVPPARIAVLYPQKGRLLDALRVTFEDAGVPVVFERQAKLPSTPLSTFVQRLAATTLAYGLAHDGQLTPNVVALLTIGPLAQTVRRTRLRAEPSAADTYLAHATRVRAIVDPSSGSDPETPATDWLAESVERLGIAGIDDEADALRDLHDTLRREDLTLRDLAAGISTLDKCVVTTYHSSKGREFDTVVLPGLVDDHIPGAEQVSGSWRRKSGASLEEQRRLFYVAVSRAERSIVLITGTLWTTPRGYVRNSAPSAFAENIRAALGLAPDDGA